jgi:ribonuclease R
MATGTARRDIERYNEQISLLCNIEGARILAKHGAEFVEPIYRVHPAPSPQKMQAFEEMLASLVAAQDLAPQDWLWSSNGKRQLWEYLDALPVGGKEGRIASAIHRQAVMANLRSTFQTEAGAHHGVGAEVYARFSAPMREMVGVFLHRELLEAESGEGQQNPELRQQVLDQANAAKTMQRDVSNEGNRLVIEQIFRDAESTKSALPGTLMGMQGSKAYVRLDQPPIDIKVYLKLAPTRLRPSGDSASLLKGGEAVHHLGDKVGVYVVSKDEDRDRWILQLGAIA